MKHLLYGGSTAARTMACNGWAEQSKDIQRRPAGQAAIDGSMHHEVMEMCQKQIRKPEDYIGLVYKEDGVKREFREDDLDLSNIAFNATNKLLDDLDIDEMEIEPFVQLIPELTGGSIDLLGLSRDRKTLLIADYKFGKYKVDPKKSDQHFCYAASAMKDTLTSDMFKDVTKIVFAIIQPKIKGTVFTWSTTPKAVAAWEKKFLKAIDGDGIHPGTHCKWCPAAPTCQTKRADVVAATSFGQRGRADLQASADLVEQVEDWVNSVKQELYFQMSRGLSVKGWKIVDKVGKRKWIDVEKAELALGKIKALRKSDITTSALMTAPQVEKVLKKKHIEFDLDKYVEKKSSGTTLVPETDDRKAVTTSENPDNLKNLVKKEGTKK